MYVRGVNGVYIDGGAGWVGAVVAWSKLIS